MSKNGTNPLPFDLPDTSLAKKASGPAEGTKEWLKAVVDEHGDTDEEKIQKRREKLSAFVALTERGLKRMQAQKKAYIAESDGQVKRLTMVLERLKKDGKDQEKEFTDTATMLADANVQRYIQETQFENLIVQTMTNLALIEGQCVLIDSVTIREEVTSKTGKQGYVRYSSAIIQDSISTDVYRTWRRTKKLYELVDMVLRKKFPECFDPKAVPIDDNDEGGEDERDFADDEIVEKSERKEIRRQVEETAS